MPVISAYAPGKVILFGEHAVVYGRPAIAVPVSQVQARATVTAEPLRPSGSVLIQAPAVRLEAALADLPPNHPLAMAIHGVLGELGLARSPACTLRVTSTIPVAAGLGSGAAVSVAIIRAFSAFLGHPLPEERVCALAYEVEKRHHGTPSGIDNTVITYAMPVYFMRGQPIETFRVARPFTLVIGDTGIASPTSQSVGDLRKAWQADPAPYERLFDAAGAIAQSARQVIENGRPEELGDLMDRNHALLQQMGVSCPALDRLVEAARLAGAAGAKLSGGGRGGNMIALVREDDRLEGGPSVGSPAEISQALQQAGAVRTLVTRIAP